MSKPFISIKKLLTTDDARVEEMVAELEASRSAAGPGTLWTDRLLPSTKGGKEG